MGRQAAVFRLIALFSTDAARYVITHRVRNALPSSSRECPSRDLPSRWSRRGAGSPSSPSVSLLPGWPSPELEESPTGTDRDFISCAFVFRLDYARGYKWKIRYVDTHVRSRDIWLADASLSPIAALRSSFLQGYLDDLPRESSLVHLFPLLFRFSRRAIIRQRDRPASMLLRSEARKQGRKEGRKEGRKLASADRDRLQAEPPLIGMNEAVVHRQPARI